ncbi:MAG: hypothetical protein V1689_05870 [Pseudomonadota bacterium]
MSDKNLLMVGIFVWVVLFGAVFAHSEKSEDSREDRASGYLEVDCNISHVSLYLCPKDNFTRKKVSSFFGLISSHQDTCSGGKLSLGTTPLSPTPIPSGKYVLLIPQGYVWEKKGPVEITVRPGERFYFLLKLFSTRSDRPEDNHGAGGGGAGGGSR